MIYVVVPAGLYGRLAPGDFSFQKIDFPLQSRQFFVESGKSGAAAHDKRVQKVGNAFDGSRNLEEKRKYCDH